MAREGCLNAQNLPVATACPPPTRSRRRGRIIAHNPATYVLFAIRLASLPDKSQKRPFASLIAESPRRRVSRGNERERVSVCESTPPADANQGAAARRDAKRQHPPEWALLPRQRIGDAIAAKQYYKSDIWEACLFFERLRHVAELALAPPAGPGGGALGGEREGRSGNYGQGAKTGPFFLTLT